MKFFLISLAWIYFLSNPSFPQAVKTDLNPPTDLTAVSDNQNNVTLDWLAPQSGGNSEYITWNTGETGNAFGFFLGPEHFATAARWNPEHLTGYDGWYIQKLKFFVTNTNPVLKLKVWTGTDATEIYSQDITEFNANEWTEITLDSPVLIDASDDVWVGLDIDMPFGDVIMGMDNGPVAVGNGDMIQYQGTWYNGDEFYVEGNWNLEVFVSENGKSTDALLGYNVYRDNETINTNLVTETTYLDPALENGSYEYYVTAVYDEGESSPSNIVNVDLLMSELYIDSLALVDLYNSCNGSNWNNHTNWLETNLDEWYGVTVQNERVTSLVLPNNNISNSIPSSFTDMSMLSIMDLSSNSILNFPINIGNMIGLTYVNVSDNGLYSFPDSFGNCINMEIFVCENNDMNYLPATIGNLSNLTEIYLHGSTIGFINETFGNLSSLEICDMSANGIYELPESFENLTTLTYLNLADNNLTAYTYNDIDNLTYLNLNNNSLVSLPEFISDLSELTELRIGGNNFQEIDLNFENLSNLVVFEAFETGISEVPSSLLNLSTLETLNLGNNSIQSLPETFNFSGLEVLKLNNNELDIIPDTYFDLDLTNLWLNNNSLEFGSLEPFVEQVSNEFSYENQELLLNDTIIDVELGDNFSLTVEVSGDFNTYQWYKGPVQLNSQTTNTLYLENIGADDIANYRLKVNNTLITDLELSTAYIELNLVTGISNVEKSEIKIYPNPSSTQTTIESDEEIQSILIYDLTGQLIDAFYNINSNNYIVNINELKNGIYYFEIKTSSKLFVKRLIKS